MKRKTIVYIASSLDGFIADENGSVAWLDEASANISDDLGYERLLKRCDTALMGYTTYEQIVHQLSQDAWPYPMLKCFVATSKTMQDKDGISFISDVKTWLIEQTKRGGKDIWIVGGAKLIRSLMEWNAIDEFELWIAPVKLHKGIFLFDFEQMEQTYECYKQEKVEGFQQRCYH